MTSPVQKIGTTLATWLESQGFKRRLWQVDPDGIVFRLSSTRVGIEIIVDQGDYLIVSMGFPDDWAMMPGISTWAQCLGLEFEDEPAGWQSWTSAERLKRANAKSNLCRQVLTLISKETPAGFQELVDCAGRRLQEYYRLRWPGLAGNKRRLE